MTGQLTVRPTRGEKFFTCKCLILIASTFSLLIFGLVILASFVFDIYVIAGCPFEYCLYIYTPNNKSLYNLTNYTANASSFGAPSAESMLQYDDWQKVVFTTATVSGLLSYYLIVILVLCPLYGVCKPCSERVCECVADIWRRLGEKEAQSSAIREMPLNPFVDSDENSTSTSLGPRQFFYFHLIFIANLAVFFASVGVFIKILVDRTSSKNPVLEGVDIAGLVTQFGSQFCAILSCFIFSKVVYAVSSKCLKMEKIFARVNDMTEWNAFLNDLGNDHYLTDDDKGEIVESGTRHLTTLKKLDSWYVKKVKNSINPYGTWFAVHWILYTLTAFMSISYFAEAIIEELYGYTHKKCFSTNNTSCVLDLVYIGLFMLEHCVLFLYPCFRAASVSTNRSRLIQELSGIIIIPLQEKESFCVYGKEEILFGCGHIPYVLSCFDFLFT